MTPWKKRIILLLLAYSMLVTAQSSNAQTAKGAAMQAPDPTTSGDIHALIIGISRYANFPSLQFADRDALAFYNLLLSDAFGADSNRIALLLNEQATQNRVDEALMNLTSFVKEGDRVFIHFSGHGGVEGLTTSKRGFLLTHETSQSNLRLTSYRIDDLNAIVGELATANKANVYLVMDACHSGKVEVEKGKGLSPVNEYLGRITYGTSFLSSGPDELSLEGNQWGDGRGLFSYHLVKGLAGDADMDSNGSVDLNEIGFYVKSRVKKEAAPSPQNPIITGNDMTISYVDPKFMDVSKGKASMTVQLAMRDINSKGYEQLFLNQLNDSQLSFYNSFIRSLDKDGCQGNECIDFSDADTHYKELAATVIPEGLEAILRRKLVAALQDKPQNLLDIIITGSIAYSNYDELCQLADNLLLSADLLGKTNYLYGVTMAKHYYFKSICHRFNKSYDTDNSLKHLSLEAADSAIAFAGDIHFFYINKGIALQALNRYGEAIEMCDRSIALKPDYVYAHNNKGVALQNLKRYDEAIAMYDRVIALKPDFAEAYYNKGNALQNLNRYDEAIAMFDSAIALKPDYVDAHNNKGVALQNLNRYDEAIAMYDRAIALKPDDASYYNNKGNALQNLNLYQEAIEMYDKAIALKPDDANAFSSKGNALANFNRYEEAIEMYYKAIALKPDDASAFSGMGNTLLNLNRYGEAIEMYDRAIALKPDDVDAHNNKGIALSNLNRYEEALEIYDRAIALKPDDADAYNYKGIAMQNLNRYEEAIEMFDRAIALKPNDADANNNKGSALWNQNRYEEAIEMYNKAIALKPNYASAYYNKGIALQSLNRNNEAIEMYDIAIALKPDDASYYNNKGNALYDLNRYEEAIAMYEKAIALEPENASVYYNKGLVLENLNRYEEAIEMYDRAIALKPDDADYYNNKGIALWNLNRYEEALDIYKRCIEINPKAKDGYLYNIGCAYSLMGHPEKALLYLEQALQNGYKNFEWIEKDSDWGNIRETEEFKALIEKYRNKH